jgi:hypothetical protein
MLVKLCRVAALLLLTTASYAHHGVAPHYDDSKPVTLDGVVSKFDFVNPHSFLYLRVKNSEGTEAEWTCELASRSVLARNGLKAEMFAPGAHVVVLGSAARHNATGCAMREARFDDGRVLRAAALYGATPATTAVPLGEADSINGVWTMKTFAVSFYEGVLTAEGERRRAAFDPIKDDPTIYCEPGSPVRFWINVNEPFEIRRDGNTVIVDSQFMDSRRVFHLDGATPGTDVPRGPMGYSAGRLEGNTLIVTTTHFTAAPLEPRRGVMHTEDLKLVERLEVNPSTHELEITWTIDDPTIFKAPHTQTETFVRTERWSEPYNCKPGYRQ